MIVVALSLAQVSGDWRVNEVQTRYRAALATITSCQKAKACQVISTMKPIADPNDTQTVERIAGEVRQGCAAEKAAYLEAVGAKVALDIPSDRKERQGIVSRLTAHADALVNRMARGWSITAAKNNGTPPEPTNSSAPGS